MLKNIVFDMGGVLIDLNRNACIEAFRQLGFSDVDKYIGEFVQSDVFLKLEEGKISENGFYAEIKKIIGGSISNEDIRTAWLCFLLSIPNKKLELLLLLKKQYNVYLLSNTNPIHFPYIVETQFCKNGHALSDYFDKCFLSYQLNMSKPRAEIFTYLLQSEDLLPEETLLIDDGMANVEMAKSLGFRTYLAKPFESFDTLKQQLLEKTL
jgi:putative hydrolase of the HAD superfamily